jgi:hypothetical protein
LVRVLRDGVLMREASSGSTRLVYSAAEQAEDGAGGALTFEVAQVSVRFGAGPFERIGFDG